MERWKIKISTYVYTLKQNKNWKKQILQKLHKYYAETKKEEISEIWEFCAADENIIKVNEIYEEEKKLS